MAERILGRPVYNYPRSLKSFYMKVNPAVDGAIDRCTVHGCDLLMPYLGELMGSSVREENYALLRRGLNPSWY